MFIILPDLNVKIIAVEVTNNAVAKKKSLKKSRLVGIRSLTSAIPVRGSNQPTGSIKFLYPVVKILKFIFSLFHYRVCCKNIYSILTAKREGGGFSHSVLGTSNGPPQPNPIRVLLCSLNSRKTGKALLQSKSFEMLKW